MSIKRKPNALYLGVSFALASMVAIPSALAQSEEVKELDRVSVTGTRIKKVEMEGQTPIQTISREQIDRSGLNSIADVLQQITASGSALNTKFNSSGNFGFPPDGGGVGAGAATVDLRHLGSKRVLVLVDGIRWVNESSASGVGGVVDLNTIPLAIVDRIEVLEDGASSIYGSDAIGGVVNIITRRDYEGLGLTLNYGEYEEGDGEKGSMDLSFGGKGENYSFFLGASYNDQKQVASNTREQSSFPKPGTGLAFGSSGTPGGRYIFTDPNTAASFNLTPNAGVSSPVYNPAETGCTRTDDYHCFTTADRFNFAQFNLLLTPSRRKSLFGQAIFDLSDNTRFYFRSLYNSRLSVNQAAPEPIFLGPAAGTGNPYADAIVISATNPYNPFGFDLNSATNLTLIGRRPIEGGPRVFEQDVETFYTAAGFEGSFEVGNRVLYWDVNAMHSTNEANQTNYGSYNIRRINQALGPVAVCNADPQCVPLDIFGFGTITPAMLAYIQPVVRDFSENKISSYSANLTGDIADLPAGPLAFAAGWEYREYKGAYRPDALTVAGEYNGVPSGPTSGKYDVSEFYTEVNIPLLADRPVAQRLDVTIAGRYSDYSTSGDVTTAKAGFRWEVNDQFLMRGSWAEGFRAPTIGELFGSLSRFDADLSDPCSAPVAAQYAANCATLVPPGYVQVNPQISVLTGGSSTLTPEESESHSFGFVWSPAFAAESGWAERFDIGVTWYQHEVESAIQAPDAQTRLNLCVATLSPQFCSGITRAASGDITNFPNFLKNIGVIETSGFDVDVGWTLPETDFGTFRVTWRNTFVNDYDAVDVDGVRQPQGVGIEVNDSGIPEWTSNLGVVWSRGQWDAGWNLRFIDSLTESCGAASTFAVCSNPTAGTNSLSSTSYHDLQLGYNADLWGGARFSLGVNNVFDQDPPICLSCSLNGYDASNYDIPGGRFWYMRAEFKFQ